MFITFFCALLWAQPEIQPWLLPNEEKRQELTRLYMQQHCGASCMEDGQGIVEMVPKVVVVHWTAGSSAKSAWHTFASSHLRGRKEIARAGNLNVSSQFLIDRDGVIYQLLPETRVARHCIGLNHLSIGIENVGDGKKYPLTDAQIQSNIELIRHLKGKYPITHLIGHHEHNRMRTHSYFQEQDPKYRTVKPDPGKENMQKIRKGLMDLQLQEPPQP